MNAVTRPWQHRLTIALVLLAGMACQTEKAEDQTADTARMAQPTAARVTPADFAALRWLEGDWRGTLPDGGYFYERYGFADDSTVVMHGFPDSSFAAAGDSARITLRGGAVYDEGAHAQWVATRLDSAIIEFEPQRGASNSFTWERATPDRWTATLRPAGGSGGKTTVYPMERVRARAGR